MNISVLQGRLAAVQATNAALQEQLAAPRNVDDSAGRPTRAKAALARPTATRSAWTPGPARKIPVSSASPGKTAARRKKRG